VRFSACGLFALLFILSPLGEVERARAQSSPGLGDTIGRVGENYAALYMQPVVDAVGANLNSGFFHTADVGTGLLPGVDLYVGVKGFGTLIPDEDRSLSLRYQTTEEVTYEGETYEADVTFNIDDAPTAFGETETGTVTGTAVYEANGEERSETRSFETLPGVFDSPVLPLGVPQVGVGVPLLGTHVSLRYLPRIGYGDLGSVQLTGGGLRHDVSSYIPLLPFSLAAHGFYQSVSIEDGDEGEVVNATAYAAGVSASKSLLLFTFYGGLQWERTTADVAYTFDPPTSELAPQSITLDLTGENSVRALAGVSFGLGPAVINVDFSQGQRSVLSAGLGVAL
jgi:hypothetical protein